MSLTAAERETTLTMTDDSKHVRIWSNQPRVLRGLKRRVGEDLVVVRTGTHDGFEWWEFEVPTARFNLAGAVKRRRKGGFGNLNPPPRPITHGDPGGVPESPTRRESQTGATDD